MQDERMYRLYVEMTDRHDRRTNVWRRVSSDEPLTHREALTMRSKMMRPAAVLLVEADSQVERDMEPLYKDWSDSLDELTAIRRDKAPPSTWTPTVKTDTLCEQCSQQAVSRPALTAYYWDGTGENPNRDVILCEITLHTGMRCGKNTIRVKAFDDR